MSNFGKADVSHIKIHLSVFRLDSICPGWREQTRNCYYEGIQFHNTG